MRIATLITILLLVVIVSWNSVTYIVDEREQAVVLQFGDPVVARTEPGLYFKLPFVQTVQILPKTRQFWGGTAADELPDLPTKDGKKVEVTPYAIWRIKDPIAFVKVLRTTENAEQRVAQFARSAVRDAVTRYDLTELVRSTNRELTYSFGLENMGDDAAPPKEATDLIEQQKKDVDATVENGRLQILKEIKSEAAKSLDSGHGGRGIELEDIGILRIDFVPRVQEAAFDRLIAFMEAIASYSTNEGERQKQEILNRTLAEVQRIEGEGAQQANEIIGKVDAEVIRAYAVALKQTEEFFVFQRTLELYRNSLGADTKIILTTEGPLWEMIKELPPLPKAEKQKTPAEASPTP